ncbi:MAG TPA: hypothetical protein VGV93_02565 [Acidimicrobiales bacterium]|nr:hypothetical protein [Acidimicrobiales bacterium]
MVVVVGLEVVVVGGFAGVELASPSEGAEHPARMSATPSAAALAVAVDLRASLLGTGSAVPLWAE